MGREISRGYKSNLHLESACNRASRSDRRVEIALYDLGVAMCGNHPISSAASAAADKWPGMEALPGFRP